MLTSWPWALSEGSPMARIALLAALVLCGCHKAKPAPTKAAYPAAARPRLAPATAPLPAPSPVIPWKTAVLVRPYPPAKPPLLSIAEIREADYGDLHSLGSASTLKDK
jgi:hypothetical protein